jgi:hypothetical protein
MTFAGVNYIAVLVAAVAAWLAGAGYYTALGKPWMAASGKTAQEIEDCKKGPHSPMPFIYAFIGAVIMAWVLAGLVGHFGAGQVTIRNGIVSGLFCWLGFVFSTMLVNYSFAMRKFMLLVIDGGYWLIVLALMGAIIGAFGV